MQDSYLTVSAAERMRSLSHMLIFVSVPVLNYAREDQADL
jgi:hypothetical protein